MFIAYSQNFHMSFHTFQLCFPTVIFIQLSDFFTGFTHYISYWFQILHSYDWCSSVLHTWHFASKIYMKDWTSDYSSLPGKLNPPTLSSGRCASKLILLFKLNHNLMDFPSCLPSLHPSPHYSLWSSHPLNLSRVIFQAECFNQPHFPITIHLWNDLPADIKSIEISSK